MPQKRTKPLETLSIEKHHCTVGVRMEKLGMVPFFQGVDRDELLRDLIVNEFEAGLHVYFDEMMKAKEFDINNAEAGREFVHNYVEFMHYAEPVYEAVRAEKAANHTH